MKGGVSAIGGHRLVKKYNNEQKDGVFSGGGYRRGCTTWAEHVGVHFGIVWGGEWDNEKRREMSLKWLPLAEPMQQPTKNRGISNGVGFLTRFCLGGTLGEDNYQSFSMAI